MKKISFLCIILLTAGLCAGCKNPDNTTNDSNIKATTVNTDSIEITLGQYSGKYAFSDYGEDCTSYVVVENINNVFQIQIVNNYSYNHYAAGVLKGNKLSSTLMNTIFPDSKTGQEDQGTCSISFTYDKDIKDYVLNVDVECNTDSNSFQWTSDGLICIENTEDNTIQISQNQYDILMEYN